MLGLRVIPPLPPHFVQSRAELERSRRRRPLSSITLLRTPNLDSSCGNLPRHLLHLPKPPVRLLPGRNRPTPTGHHWRCLKLAPRQSASPVILRLNRPREWIRGEFLVLPGLFPFPWRVAGAGERSPPSCCRLWRGSKIRYRGRSAWEARTVRRSV